MKFISICFLIVFTSVLGNVKAQQDKEYEQLKETMWSDPDFTGTAVPEKWLNESAVVLAKAYIYEVEKKSMVHENIFLHKRIKLIDKSSINDFSEFSFDNDYRRSAFGYGTEVKDVSIGIKVVKPSGKENIIDLKDAVLNEIKEGYRKKEYKKIAIPDLEVGDIIDYFYVIKNSYAEPAMKILDPVFYQLVEQYPIMKQKFDVRILRLMYFNSKSINGAPKLKKIITDDQTIYSLVDSDREKGDANLWDSPLRIYPTLKFQAFYIKNYALNYLPFLDFFLKEKEMNSSSVDLTQMDKLVRGVYDTPALFDLYLISSTKSYLSKNVDKNAPTDTIVKYAYYYLRQFASQYGPNSLMLNLSKVLEYKKIKHDLVVTVPRYISDISDLILPRELGYILRIKGNPDYFIGDYSPISLFKTISSDFQGNNAYAVSNPNLDMPKVEKIVIPIDKPDDNKESIALKVKLLEESSDSLNISIEKSVKGFGRTDDIGYVITEVNYLDNVKANLYKPKKPKKKSKKELEAEKNKVLALEQQQKDVEQSLKTIFEREFTDEDDLKIRDFKVIQMGIWENAPELKYSLNFNVGNLVKKMGQNYMISIGKIITRQLELSSKDMERKIDIYAPYPRTFEYKINFEIPADYKVKGLEKLNVNVVNSTGGFTAKPVIENNNLVVNIAKFYNHNFEKVSEWPRMVEFIEAAFTFTQQNILLEKVGK
jgi:hypothetical protein